MYQRAIYSQHSNPKFGFLSDLSCVRELCFLFKFFSLLDQIFCLQGRWVDLWQNNIRDENLWKNECFYS